MRAEDIIQAAIVAYLDRVLPADSYFCAIPNGFNKTKAGRGIAKATGLRAGAPDLVMLIGGYFVGLEVKTPTGRLQPTQAAAAEKIRAAGGIYQVVRSVDDVEALLAHLEVPVRGRLAA